MLSFINKPNVWKNNKHITSEWWFIDNIGLSKGNNVHTVSIIDYSANKNDIIYVLNGTNTYVSFPIGD